MSDATTTHANQSNQSAKAAAKLVIAGHTAATSTDQKSTALSFYKVPGKGYSATSQTVKQGYIAARGYQQLTGMTTATSLTVPVGATFCDIVAEAQAVRFRDDGVAPTATVGQLLSVGAAPYRYTGNLYSIEFIAASSGAILNVTFYS